LRIHDLQESFRIRKDSQNPTLYTYVELLDAEEARRIANDHLSNINTHREQLRKLWEANKAIIVYRWQKNAKKRTNYLQLAEPDLYKTQWIGASLAIRDSGTLRQEVKNYRRELLLDYINVDSLVGDPSRFLGLLKNRIRYAPPEWTSYDN
jgi:hypothetical protein